MNHKKKLVFGAVLAGMFAVTTALAFTQEHGTAHEPAQAGPGNTEGHALAPHGGAGEHAEHGEAADHAEGGHHALEPLNWTDVFDKKRPAVISLFINFGLLFGLYYMLGKKPVGEALKQRRVTIAKDIEDAKKRLEESEERAKKYQGELKNVDADTATVKANLVTSAKADVERMKREAVERADRMKRDATRLVDQEKKQIQEDILRETVERSLAEAQRVLEQTTSPDDHKRLAEDLLSELAKMPAARRVA